MSGRRIGSRLGLVEIDPSRRSEMSASHTNSSAVTAGTTWRELAHRDGDGLAISLFWNTVDDRVKVAISDSRNDTKLAFDIAGADALAAFNHPFAYAALRSFGSVEVEREPLNLQTQA
jgi:hypothetical protein